MIKYEGGSFIICALLLCTCDIFRNKKSMQIPGVYARPIESETLRMGLSLILNKFENHGWNDYCIGLGAKFTSRFCYSTGCVSLRVPVQFSEPQLALLRNWDRHQR